MTPAEQNERLRRAYTALTGLWVGDCFGGMYFVQGAEEAVADRLLFAPEWDFTDDTQMALSVYANLQRYQEIRQDELATDFARHYTPERGYGPSMHGQLQSIRQGKSWREAASEPFDGQGTFGNGAAMRIAPIGAYFADDPKRCATQAILAS